MKVYLIKTPKCDSDEFEGVQELLNSINGPLNFTASQHEFLSTDFEFLEESYFKDVSGAKGLVCRGATWQQLFSLCNCYREKFSIDKHDFVVLLTEINNDQNWFSCYDKQQNVFVHTGDWHRILDANPKYPIAYQVVENIIQSLMKIDMDIIPNENVHSESRGCMNDFCQNKEQIILKLRTADICPACMEKMQNEEIEHEIIMQASNIFEAIRNELLFKQRFRHQVQPVTIVINERKKILLPDLNNLEIRLNPLFKTLYIFYLKHSQGVRLNELNDFREELLSLYRRLSATDNNQTIEARINDLVNPIGGSFSQKKSKLNRIITELLGEPLASFYRIEGEPGEPFKINRAIASKIGQGQRSYLKSNIEQQEGTEEFRVKTMKKTKLRCGSCLRQSKTRA